MVQQLFSVRTEDPELAARARLLIATALFVAVGSLAFLPITLSSGASPINSLLTPLLALIVIIMVRRALVIPAAVVLIAGLFATLLISAPAEQLVHHSAGMAFIIPILVAGLVLGALAVLISGILSIAIIAALALAQGVPWDIETWVNIVLLVLASGLIYLIIRVLESSLAESRHKANESLKAHEELRAREQALVSANAELQNSNQQMEALLSLVRELEVPVIPLLEGVLVVPLIGHLDTRRVDQINRAVLESVYEQRAHTAIIDITGITVVDTAVAQRIEHLAQSIQLLGARVMLTGIRADVAQTITDLNLNFSAIQTAGRLQDGVATVLGEVGRRN